MKLRNVTAVGEAFGAGYSIDGSGANFYVDAKNVIAAATSPSGTDVMATATGSVRRVHPGELELRH